MITIIDGWWGSGKSTLRGLLDGHPELFVSPIQDGVFGGFAAAERFQNVLEFKDLSELRKVLCGLGEYNRIEKDAWARSVFNAASGDSWDYGGFNFDFYAFDRSFISKVMALKSWDAEQLVEILYSTMLEFWKEFESDADMIKGYVSMDNNLGRTAEFIVAHAPNTKYIWVDRSSADIVAVHVKRKPITGNLGTKGWGSHSVRGLIRSGYVARHERRRNEILNLQAAHTDRVLVVALEDLVERNEATMLRVADFIGIRYLPILNQYTYAGKPFPGSNAYVGKLNDTAATILDDEERRMIAREVRAHELGRLSFRNNYRRLRRSVGALIRSLSEA